MSRRPVHPFFLLSVLTVDHYNTPRYDGAAVFATAHISGGHLNPAGLCMEFVHCVSCNACAIFPSHCRMLLHNRRSFHVAVSLAQFLRRKISFPRFVMYVLVQM